jgi:nickel/cobalt exporter
MPLNAVLVLTLGAVAVAVFHSAMPDHWVPLAIVARGSRWTISRTARVSLLAGLGHVGASLVLGIAIGAIVPLGADAPLQEGRLIGTLLVLTGVALYAYSRLSRRRGTRRRAPPNSLAQMIVPFGVAASPNLAIVPVALAAAGLGWQALAASLIAFTAGTLATFLVLTVLGTLGGYLVEWPWLERNGDSVSAGLLVVIGIIAFFAL